MSQVHSINGRGRPRAATSAVSQAWDGALDEAELAKPGGLLLAALVAAAARRGHQLSELSGQLGITYGYLAQLRNGTKHVNQVGDDFVKACSSYLQVPRLTVLMLAGRITPTDFFESETMLPPAVERAYAMVCEDPVWGPMQTAELRKASVESRFTVIRLYEAATGLRLMPEAINMRTLAESTAAMAAIAAAKQTEVATSSPAGELAAAEA